jgi:hypothetical protein
MKYALILFILLLLSSCGGGTQLVRPEPVEVPTLVVERCIDVSKIPAKPKSRMDPAGDVGQKAAGAVLDLEALEAYIDELLILLNDCAI